MTAFVLASTDHGPLIVNRHDHNEAFNGQRYGVGAQLLDNGTYDPGDVANLKNLLLCRREHFGPGVVALDIGANLGVHAVEWAKLMRDWGFVIAIEAQERIFYSLCGNLNLNNCLNARAVWAAVDETCGKMMIPEPDYTKPASFGSFELKARMGTEFIGQPIDYGKPTLEVDTITIDAITVPRCDIIKIDVEGMEEAALRGAAKTLEQFKPLLFVETIKSDKDAIEAYLKGFGYEIIANGMNILAVHKDDPTREQVKVADGPA